MADTGPIFSIFPTSSVSTLEKIPVRRDCRAFAVQRYSASPVRSSAARTNTAVTRAARTACQAPAAVSSGEATFPKNPEIIRAKAAVPASTASLRPAMTKIHPHSPLAMRMSVRFSKSILGFLFPYFLPLPLWKRDCILYIYPESPAAHRRHAGLL